MHDERAAHHVTAKGRTDGLMTETDAENRNFSGEVLDRRDRDAGLLRRTGSGRDDDAGGLKNFYLGQGDLVVAMDLNSFSQLAEILDDVEGE